MIKNLIIIIYLAAWSLLCLLLAIIGRIIENRKQSVRIMPTSPIRNSQPAQGIESPQKSQIIPTNTTIQPKNSARKTKRAKTMKEELDDFFHGEGPTPQPGGQSRDDDTSRAGLFRSPSRLIDQGMNTQQTPSPTKVRQLKRQGTIQRQELMKKTTLIMPDGQVCGQYKLDLRNRKKKRTINLATDRNPVGSPLKSAQHTEPNEIIAPLSIPVEPHKYYKLCWLSKVYHKSIANVSKPFRIGIVYIRQTLNFAICCLLLYQEIEQIYILISVSFTITIIMRNIDKWLINRMVKQQNLLLIKWIYGVLFLCCSAIMIFVVASQQIDDNLWLFSVLVGFGLDILLIDPIKHTFYWLCLKQEEVEQEPQQNIQHIIGID